MRAETEQRRLAAIMFTDMVGYSALSQNNPKVAVELLEEHRELLREIFPRFRAMIIELKRRGHTLSIRGAFPFSIVAN